jgi:hypothetical protein
MIAVAMALAGAQLATAPIAPVDEPDPKQMSRADIRKFNAVLARDHPYYIRCEKRSETGSLVKKLYSCRTNEQWQKADAVGNDAAREMGDHFAPKFMSQSG